MEDNITQPLTDEQLMAAKQDIEAVLQKHGVLLVPIVIHHGDRTISRIDITPAPKQDAAAPKQDAVEPRPIPQ